MAENVIELTDTAFKEIVQNCDLPVLVDFRAPRCGSCKMIAPIVPEIADDYQ